MHQPGGVKICVECERRHQEALDSLAAGTFVGECSECGLNGDELRARGRCGPRGEMAVHYEGGKYRIMCLACDRGYVPKRKELYTSDTEFGRSIAN